MSGRQEGQVGHQQGSWLALRAGAYRPLPRPAPWPQEPCGSSRDSAQEREGGERGERTGAWLGRDPQARLSRAGLQEWRPLRTSSFAQDQVCLPGPTPGRDGLLKSAGTHVPPGSSALARRHQPDEQREHLLSPASPDVYLEDGPGRTRVSPRFPGCFLQVHEGLPFITPERHFPPVFLPDQVKSLFKNSL